MLLTVHFFADVSSIYSDPATISTKLFIMYEICIQMNWRELTGHVLYLLQMNNPLFSKVCIKTFQYCKIRSLPIYFMCLSAHIIFVFIKSDQAG